MNIIGGIEGTRIGENTFIVSLCNNTSIRIEKNVEYNGNIWGYKIETQYFDREKDALYYLHNLIIEKMTGIRFILHVKREVPTICSTADGCRHKGHCNTALCYDCPIAEQFFAERDGVSLVYPIVSD